MELKVRERITVLTYPQIQPKQTQQMEPKRPNEMRAQIEGTNERTNERITLCTGNNMAADCWMA